MSKKLLAVLDLEYYKQGDDLENCVVLNNGERDVKLTLEKHIVLLNNSISKLKRILDSLPNNFRNEDLTIQGDTHIIFFEGKQSIIELLVNKNLIQIEDNEVEVHNVTDLSTLMSKVADK